MVRQVLALYFLPLEAQTALGEQVALEVLELLRLHCVTHSRLPVVRVVHLLLGLLAVVVVVHHMELAVLAALLLVPVQVEVVGVVLEACVLQAPVVAVVVCLLAAQQQPLLTRMAVEGGLLVLETALTMVLAGMVVQDHLLVVVEASPQYLLQTMVLEKVLYLTFHQDRYPVVVAAEAVTQLLQAAVMVALAAAVAAGRGKAVRVVSVAVEVELE